MILGACTVDGANINWGVVVCYVIHGSSAPEVLLSQSEFRDQAAGELFSGIGHKLTNEYSLRNKSPIFALYTTFERVVVFAIGTSALSIAFVSGLAKQA